VSDEAEAPIVACRHCAAPAVLCEEHAGALVARAFSEDADNRRDFATGSLERNLRRTADARAVADVLRRWFRDEALEVARDVVKQLEGKK